MTSKEDSATTRDVPGTVRTQNRWYDRFDITHQGRPRTFYVHWPKDRVPKKPLPVMIGLHGGGGSALRFLTTLGIVKFCDRANFILVLPEGTKRPGTDNGTWNADLCCGYAREQSVDDVGFIATIADLLQSAHVCDGHRNYLFGMSNGGMLAYRILSERPDRFAAAAVVASSFLRGNFAPALATPVMHLHSENDPIIPYPGGQGPSIENPEDGSIAPGPMYPAVEAVMGRWATRNGCTGAGLRSTRKWKKHVARLLWYPDPKGRAPVALWKMTGPGHVWPSGWHSPDYLAKAGEATQVLNANEEIWSFVSKYSR